MKNCSEVVFIFLAFLFRSFKFHLFLVILNHNNEKGRAIAQVDSCLFRTASPPFQFKVILCRLCGGQCGTVVLLLLPIVIALTAP